MDFSHTRTHTHIHTHTQIYIYIYIHTHKVNDYCAHTFTYAYIYIYIYIYRSIGLVGRVFTNGPRDLGSIQGRVIPKTLKMVLDVSLLNTQHYKVHIKGKV